MKRSSSELKSLARGALTGNFALSIGAFALLGGFSFLLTSIVQFATSGNSGFSILANGLCTFIASLLTSLLSVGFTKLMLNISRGQEAHLKDLFFSFSNQPDKIIMTALSFSCIFLGCILPGGILYLAGSLLTNPVFLVIGVLALLAGSVAYLFLIFGFAIVFFLYLDHPEMEVTELLRQSRLMMKGHKLRYFYVNISFIGLLLLSILTCFIGLLWVFPYIEMTLAEFYRDLIGEI